MILCGFFHSDILFRILPFSIFLLRSLWPTYSHQFAVLLHVGKLVLDGPWLWNRVLDGVLRFATSSGGRAAGDWLGCLCLHRAGLHLIDDFWFLGRAKTWFQEIPGWLELVVFKNRTDLVPRLVVLQALDWLLWLGFVVWLQSIGQCVLRFDSSFELNFPLTLDKGI